MLYFKAILEYCTKIDFGWGLIHLRPIPSERSPDLLAGFYGFYGRERREGEREREETGMKGKGEGKEWHGRGRPSEFSPPEKFPSYASG